MKRLHSPLNRCSPSAVSNNCAEAATDDCDENQSSYSEQLLDTKELHHILTDSVRRQYVRFLRDVLTANYSRCETVFRDVDVASHCRRLEERAIRSCMIVKLYRQSVLETIATIRQKTDQRQLYSGGIDSNVADTDIGFLYDSSRVSEEPVKGEDQPSLPERESLQSRLDRIAADEAAERINSTKSSNDTRTRNYERYRSRHESSRRISAPKPTQTTTAAKVSAYPHVKQLAISPPKDETDADIDDDLFRQMTEICGSYATPPPSMTTLPPSPTPDAAAVISTKHTSTQQAEPSTSKRLRGSLWPCELHMQRLRLQAALAKYAAKCDDDDQSQNGWRHLERLRRRFDELFGGDDDDDDVADGEDVFAPYSPSLEMNDELMASCRHRIAPWIVRHLMRPLQQGHIASRYLFKRLAKFLAAQIIQVDQYPDEILIRDVVAQFFESQPIVQSLEDIC